MKIRIYFFLLVIFIFTACSVKPLQAIQYEDINKEISFQKDIKPILDNRCVTCHSCYNSPCQLKLSSYDGLQRGATKNAVYENRLSAAQPTRLFIDAINEQQWREKDFYSVTEKIENKNESIMMRYLFQKEKDPLLLGSYSPETDKLTCAKDENELAKYFEENPHKGMPYGFPNLKKEEYNLLMTWLKNGAVDDTIKNKTSVNEKLLIDKFEKFFNNTDIKNQVTARYIYEHLFLAHISFNKKSGNFFELVRSYTKDGDIDIVATRFPYDEVEKKFYYRFRKIESTIVHKTHMVYELDEKKLTRYNELFIEPKWNDDKIYMPNYDSKISANPLNTFKQIPADSRYQFLLDNIHYFIMTFIRGPVCKGQIALNVINDHFWVMFMDPKYDIAVKNRYYLEDNIQHLSLPNKYGENPDLLETFTVLENYEQATTYFQNKNNIYKEYYKNGIPLEALWKGNKKEQNDSILTIYRHFDSASVHKGALGNLPRTLWVIDFPLLERLYYSLVAGFDVFGSTQHQFLVRKHMDRLRIEGETNFLEFLPQNSRKGYFNSWYKGWVAKYFTYYIPSDNEPNITYKSDDYKDEFINKFFKYANIKKDPINFIEADHVPAKILKHYQTKEQIEATLKTLTLPNNSKIIQSYTNDKSNLAYIKIELNNGENLVYSMVINRWHDNVALMFVEDLRLDAKKDRVNFINGFVGSYPNVFVVVKEDDLNEFFNLVYNYQDTLEDKKLLLKYAVNRANPKFWEVYDWFTNEFKKQDPLNFGIFDLNRYYDKAISE